MIYSRKQSAVVAFRLWPFRPQILLLLLPLQLRLQLQLPLLVKRQNLCRDQKQAAICRTNLPLSVDVSECLVSV